MADKNYGLTTDVIDVDDNNEARNNPLQTGLGEKSLSSNGIVNFSFVMQAGWEGMGFSLPLLFMNGGPAVLIYGPLAGAIGSLAVASSLGEMASMDPHVGAQYRWSAGFARRWPAFWGLFQGWITVFVWMVNPGINLLIMAQTVQGLITIYSPSYVLERWHTTMLMWAFLLASIVCNLYLRRILSTVETLGGICHVVLFIIVVAVLTTLAERSSTDFVFNTLISGVSGWNSPGVCWNIGFSATVLGLVNCDGVTHMIDETKEPRKRVPRTMCLAIVFNATINFAMGLVLMYCIGDLDAVLSSPMPIFEIYYQATKSKTATSILVALQAAVIGVSLFNITASSSRLTWAFARDKGLPFHQFFSYVHPKLQIPLPALGLVTVVLGLVALLNIGSDVVFSALISLPTVALSVSYIIPITLLTIRKLTGEHPRYGPWQLGRWGLPINLFAIMFLIFLLTWTPFPPALPVSHKTMNYSGPITLAVILSAVLDWFTTGHKRFQIQKSPANIELEDEKDSKTTRCD